MKKGSKIAALIGAVALLAAIVTTIVSVLMYLDRRKADEELEDYLENAIQ